jgi:hypothetical protein
MQGFEERLSNLEQKQTRYKNKRYAKPDSSPSIKVVPKHQPPESRPETPPSIPEETPVSTSKPISSNLILPEHGEPQKQPVSSSVPIGNESHSTVLDSAQSQITKSQRRPMVGQVQVGKRENKFYDPNLQQSIARDPQLNKDKEIDQKLNPQRVPNTREDPTCVAMCLGCKQLFRVSKQLARYDSDFKKHIFKCDNCLRG